MKIICKNLLQLKSKKFKDFLNVVKNPEEVNRALLEVCVPESYAIEGKSFESIDQEKCTGCLLCVDKKEAKYITLNDVPRKNKGAKSLSKRAKKFFQGKYITNPFSSKLASHTNSRETQILNPISALYLWRLSKNPERTYFCSSPNWELSIETVNRLDEREGHLDIVVSPSEGSLVCVLEGKASVNSFLRNTLRDQWKRYEKKIKSIADEVGYDAIFSYVIGGDELALYPSTSSPPYHARRDEFYEDISSENKKFISIEALRALRAYQITINQFWGWEKHFPALFSSSNFLGLVSGGVIWKDSLGYSLRKAPWL